MELKSLKIGIIGGGKMAEAILRGVLNAGLFSGEQITISDICHERLKELKDVYDVKISLDNQHVVSKSEVILLSVKPQNMRGLLQEIGAVSSDKKLYLSIAAGLKAEALSAGLSGNGRIIRIMPNTAARVLQSASALCLGPGATQEDLAIAKQIFEAVGTAEVVSEDLMDAVTGLSGSGPAYIFLMIQALADAGVKAGLARDIAQSLAAQTCMGAAKLMLETGEHPEVLKDQVTSPAGTTIAGIQVLEKKAVRGAVMKAVEAAVNRSKELGK